MGDDFEGTPNPLNPRVGMKRPVPVVTPEPMVEAPKPVTKPVMPAIKQSVAPAVKQPVATQPKLAPRPIPKPPVVNVPRPATVKVPKPLVMDMQLPKRPLGAQKILPSQPPVQNLAQPEKQPSEFDELNTATMGVVTNLDGSTPDASLDPTKRQMAKVPTVIKRKPRRLRKSYVVATMLSVLVAVGCAVTAVLLIISNQNTDSVAKAMEIFAKGDASNNVVVDGTITVNVTDASSQMTDLKINLQSVGMLNSMANTTGFSIDAGLKDGTRMSVEINELYGQTGNLYLKMKGLAQLLQKTSGSETVAGDGTEEASEEADGDGTEEASEDGEETTVATAASPTDLLIEALNIVDGTWIRLGGAGASEAWPENHDLVCTSGLISGLAESRSGLGEVYAENPFVVSSTRDISLESKQYPVRRVELDKENFTNFMGQAAILTPITNFMSCMGTEGAKLDTEKLFTKITEGPEILVEVNNNYEITRIYLKGEFDGGNFEADLSLTYPINVNVVEPQDYTDLVDLISGVAIPDTAEEELEEDTEIEEAETAEAFETEEETTEEAEETPEIEETPEDEAEGY